MYRLYSICYVRVYYCANPKEVTEITALVPEIFIRAYSKILNVQENSIVFILLLFYHSISWNFLNPINEYASALVAMTKNMPENNRIYDFLINIASCI